MGTTREEMRRRVEEAAKADPETKRKREEEARARWSLRWLKNVRDLIADATTNNKGEAGGA